ncbi:hypothetical protein POM88_023954 [Heracleum sosnowskyi]|uniref:Uncharacterized protein n=1 Tax=Heracleum sosnowskyi TaxID=360622 RepID=A0AAD8IJM8_9APIA|nr:hypothetical protein POM88_023954 [Heracleum sosnowskyi]
MQLLARILRQGTSSARFIYQFVTRQSIGSAFLRGSSLFGGIKFNSYRGAFGYGMSGGACLRGCASTLQQYGSYGSGGKYGGCMEYLSDQMNTPYGEMMTEVSQGSGVKMVQRWSTEDRGGAQSTGGRRWRWTEDDGGGGELTEEDEGGQRWR